MKIAILADTHFGARGDSPTFHEYFSRFFREIFFPYIDQFNIHTVVHLGDLVDRRKFLNFSTANVMRKSYIEQSLFRQLETHIIAGNHDCFHKNNNEVNALRETVMGKDRFYVYSNPATVLIDQVPFFMLPWISPENEEKSAQQLQSTNAQYCFAHLELAGFEMTRGQVMTHGMDPATFDKFKAVYTGHYHHRSSKGNIHYLGAPYEMTWADCDDQKGFHVFDTDTKEIEFIPNPLTLYKKIHITANSEIIDPKAFKDQIVKLIIHDKDKKLKDLDGYVKLVENEALDIQVIDEHLSVDETSGQTIMVEDVEDTMQIVKNYVMASEIDVDKDALFDLMKELHVEAQHAQ